MKKPFIAFYSQEGQNGHVDLRAIAPGKNWFGGSLLKLTQNWSLLFKAILQDLEGLVSFCPHPKNHFTAMRQA